MATSAIYQILNVKNGKSYIGCSLNIKKRFYEHKRRLNKNTHPNKYLQNAWNINKDDFVFNIIEECSLEELEKKEMYYIAKLGTFYKDGNGYNLTIGGDGLKGGETHPRYGKAPWNKGLKTNTIPWNKGLKNPIPHKNGNYNEKRIIQLDKNENVINEWNSIVDAYRSLCISRTAIGNCLSGYSKTAGNFVWQYKQKKVGGLSVLVRSAVQEE